MKSQAAVTHQGQKTKQKPSFKLLGIMKTIFSNWVQEFPTKFEITGNLSAQAADHEGSATFVYTEAKKNKSHNMESEKRTALSLIFFKSERR